MGKKFEDKLETKIDEWDDEEVLKAFCKFFRRVDISTQQIQEQESGLITHQLLMIASGDKVIASEPLAYEWPLQPASFPEEADIAVN